MLYFLPGFYHDRCRNSYIQANGVIRALGYANAKNCDVRCINLWDTAESVTHRYKYKSVSYTHLPCSEQRDVDYLICLLYTSRCV